MSLSDLMAPELFPIAFAGYLLGFAALFVFLRTIGKPRVEPEREPAPARVPPAQVRDVSSRDTVEALEADIDPGFSGGGPAPASPREPQAGTVPPPGPSQESAPLAPVPTREGPAGTEPQGLALRQEYKLSGLSSTRIRAIDPGSVELSADQMLSPLQSVLKQLSEARGDEGLSQNSKSLLGNAENRLRRLVHHIEEIDLMLQISSGDLRTRSGLFDPRAILRKLVDAATRSSRTDGGVVRFYDRDEGKESYLIDADERLFERILSRLMNTAYRAGQGGELSVTYESTARQDHVFTQDLFFLADDAEGRVARRIFVEVRFRTGGAGRAEGEGDPLALIVAGMINGDEDYLKRIQSGRKDTEGLLFGLALARDLAEEIGGDVRFETTGDYGHFRFSLNAESFAGESPNRG